MINEWDVKELMRRLRTGDLGREHSPARVADVLDELWRDKMYAEAAVRESESLNSTVQTRAHARTTYAIGYTDAIKAALEILPVDAAVMIANLSPSNTRASEVAKAA